MPITSEPQINDISEAALAERIQLRKVKDAVDIFDQLLQAGKPVSLESTNNLLDLICFYGDREPAQENEPAPKDSEVLMYILSMHSSLQRLKQEKNMQRNGISLRNSADLLSAVLDEIEGKQLTVQDSDDVNFFVSAMKILFYPNYQGMRELLQALDADNRLEVIPHIWEDIKQFGLATKADLVEEVLMLMARDKHSFEVQNSFADCAVSVMSAYEGTDSDRSALNWTSGSLANVATLLLRADRIQESW
ncbi:PTCD3 protein, partial [Polypterus senegalus]